MCVSSPTSPNQGNTISTSQSTLSYHSTQQSGTDSDEYVSDQGNDDQPDREKG